MLNNNPSGKNQYKACRMSSFSAYICFINLHPAPPHCSITRDLIINMTYKKNQSGTYGPHSCCSNSSYPYGVYPISLLLFISQGFLSKRTVERRLQALQAMGLAYTMHTFKKISVAEKRQLLADELAKDSANNRWPRWVWKCLGLSGIHLPWWMLKHIWESGLTIVSSDWISEAMHNLYPQGFEQRKPTAKKIWRVPLTAAGPNDEWSMDGNDKSVIHGFAHYGIHDKFSRKYLTLVVVPNNRLKDVIVHIFLETVEKIGGMFQLPSFSKLHWLYK